MKMQLGFPKLLSFWNDEVKKEWSSGDRRGKLTKNWGDSGREQDTHTHTHTFCTHINEWEENEVSNQPAFCVKVFFCASF